MTVNTNHFTTPQPIDEFLTIWERWIALWNGDLALAGIIGEQFVRNLPGTRGRPRSREWFAELVTDFRDRNSRLRLVTDAGPFISQGLVVGRWSVLCEPAVRLCGNMSHDSGRAARIASGTDILKIDTARIVECWTTTNLAAMNSERRWADVG